MKAIDPQLHALPRVEHEVKTCEYKEALEAGDWEGQDDYVRRQALEIQSSFDSNHSQCIHYFGLAEIPHVIALGSYIGDERPIEIHEYDRDANSWSWPSHELTINLEVIGLPSGPPVTSRGIVTIRISISAEISEADVQSVVGSEALADIIIRPRGGGRITAIRSNADLASVRSVVRQAFAALLNNRPNIDTIHLFVAAPVSVSFVVGQELKVRNCPPIQTYRYRKISGDNAYKPAILIAEGGMAGDATTFSKEQVDSAKASRTQVWQRVLNEVIEFARPKRVHGEEHAWYENNSNADLLKLVKPFEALPQLGAIVPERCSVVPETNIREYRYEKDNGNWHIGDGLVIAWDETFRGADRNLRDIIRLFFFHEYLHDYQTITADTALEIGKFGHCLEYIDYVADAYAILCQLDWAKQNSRSALLSEEQQKRFIADQIDLMLKSFWAFRAGRHNELQVRQLRRFLNWYWRHIQIIRANSLLTVLKLLSRPPKIEIGGLLQVARGRRLFAALDRFDKTSSLELALVLEDERIFRVSEASNTSLKNLLTAFINEEHDKIQAFFRSGFDFARATGGALPDETSD